MQMLGLTVNAYLDKTDEKEYKRHRAKASTLDLGDMSVPFADFSLPVDEGMPRMESDDDEPSLSTTSKRSSSHWM
jgi:hypothetical protein